MAGFVGTLCRISALVSMWVLLAQFGSSTDDCQRTAADEVDALHDIAKVLGKKDWNFKEDPCTNHTSYTSWFFKRNPARKNYVNQVTCKCFGGKWLLINISLKGQDLAGTLPKSLAKLRHLKTIDLSRNLLNGTIPREWATMKLEYISIESNFFSGTVPAELGRLINLHNLTLNDNYLTGRLPIELKNLTNLTELRISSKNFTGGILDYFQSWKQLQKLEIQGSGFEGPIPSSISALTSLIELRISDLNGASSEFLPLENLTGLIRLLVAFVDIRMLRNCRLSGSIPHYIQEMTQLKTMDLSFNNLTGFIPDELRFLTSLQNVYLTNNMLSGPIPS